MKKQYTIANAMDGFSKAICLNHEDGSSDLAIRIEVLYNDTVSDVVLDELQHCIGEILLKVEEQMLSTSLLNGRQPITRQE